MIITQNTTFYTKILLKIGGKSNLLPINLQNTTYYNTKIIKITKKNDFG